MQLVPNLNFSGQCREALHAYEKAFQGQITCLITYGEANDPAYLPLLREDQLDYVYHAELVLGNQRIIMSDHVDLPLQPCYTNFLTVMFDRVADVKRAYAALQEGSATIYPMEKTAYSACRVAFVDRFGIRWGIMVEGNEV